ncbi:hypothetical protein HU200_056314 [Digitaria exilis]|uniref:PIR2-like helical domain-containing protein n=1 Tax=Digitaria exilis TaxID=1010633 RepID=A0A835AGW5_9POAL|nr:hypothetical protein HU200_056314 [Digitaria exilis]
MPALLLKGSLLNHGVRPVLTLSLPRHRISGFYSDLPPRSDLPTHARIFRFAQRLRKGSSPPAVPTFVLEGEKLTSDVHNSPKGRLLVLDLEHEEESNGEGRRAWGSFLLGEDGDVVEQLAGVELRRPSGEAPARWKGGGVAPWSLLSTLERERGEREWEWRVRWGKDELQLSSPWEVTVQKMRCHWGFPELPTSSRKFRFSPEHGSSSVIPRVYGPRTLEDDFYLDEKKDEIQTVLAKIEGIYSRVKLDKELVMGNGFCFGLLDPVTNILVNSVISKAKAAAAPADAAPPPADGGGAGRKRPRADRDMNRRSHDGLVAFLTCLFPYLPDAEARVYLYVAEVDPLVAALLVVNHRQMRQFGFCSGITVAAVETALRCAAVAANHPDPSRLVLGWKLLSHGLQKFVSEISSKESDTTTVARHVLSTVNFTGASSDTELQLKEPWELAESRLHGNGNQIVRELPPAQGAMKRMLLATIHGFHLQALARLPTAELSSRYHRSLLEGGYCYGPLDPVSNIIVNTVWYDQNFPAGKQVTLDMISTACLWRVAARSLYGLVSFLCTRYQNIACWCPGPTFKLLIPTFWMMFLTETVS